MKKPFSLKILLVFCLVGAVLTSGCTLPQKKPTIRCNYPADGFECNERAAGYIQRCEPAYLYMGTGTAGSGYIMELYIDVVGEDNSRYCKLHYEITKLDYDGTEELPYNVGDYMDCRMPPGYDVNTGPPKKEWCEGPLYDPMYGGGEYVQDYMDNLTASDIELRDYFCIYEEGGKSVPVIVVSNNGDDAINTEDISIVDTGTGDEVSGLWYYVTGEETELILAGSNAKWEMDCSAGDCSSGAYTLRIVVPGTARSQIARIVCA